MTKPPLLMIPRRHICNWRGCTRAYYNHSARPMLACPLCRFLPEFKEWALERKRAQRRAHVR